MPLILNFDFFSGFSPASTRSAPMLALELAQPRFLLPAHESKKPAHANISSPFLINCELDWVNTNRVATLKVSVFGQKWHAAPLFCFRAGL